MQRATKPGWSFIELPPATEQQLQSIIDKVPSEWRLDPHGKPAPKHVQKIHSTFVSDLSQSKQAEIEKKFESILAETAPVEARFNPEGITLGLVERIKAQPTVCAAIGIVSPQLRALREKIVAAVADGAKVYYDTHGHVSLVYVPAKQRDDLEKLMKSIGANAEGQGIGGTFLIDRVIVEWGKDHRKEFRLEGKKAPTA